MGLLRNIAKAITLLLFSISLYLLILTFFFFELTDYENAKNLFSTLFKEAVNKNERQKIEEVYNKTVYYCSIYQNQSIQLPNNITIMCYEILNTNLDYLLSLLAERSFNQLYYKTYECEILECVKEIKSGEDFAIFLSLKAHNFFGNILQPLLILTIIFGLLLFFSIETWLGRIKVFGFEFFSIGMFYLFIPFFKKLVFEKFLKEIPIGENVLDLILDKFESTLLIFLLSGLVLIFTWIFLKFFVKKSKSK